MVGSEVSQADIETLAPAIELYRACARHCQRSRRFGAAIELCLEEAWSVNSTADGQPRESKKSDLAEALQALPDPCFQYSSKT